MENIVNEFVQRYSRLPTERDPDYLEMLRMSKYRLLAVPNTRPGKCANCGSAKDDGRIYIDFGLEIDWYGTVYICSHCLLDIAKSVGLFKELEEKLGLLLAERENLDSLKFQGVELHESVVKTFEELKEYYARLHSISNDSNTSIPPSVESEQTKQATSESGASESESGTPESTDGPRRKNVRSLANLLEGGGTE